MIFQKCKSDHVTSLLKLLLWFYISCWVKAKELISYQFIWTHCIPASLAFLLFDHCRHDLQYPLHLLSQVLWTCWALCMEWPSSRYMYVLLHCFIFFKHLLKCHHSGLGSMGSRFCGSGTQDVNLAVLLVSTCVEGSGRKLKWAEGESNLWNKPNDSLNCEWALELKWPVRAVLHWPESSVLFILFFVQDWPWVRGLFAAELILEAAISISRSWGISPPLKGGLDIL